MVADFLLTVVEQTMVCMSSYIGYITIVVSQLLCMLFYLQYAGLHKRGKACLAFFSIPEVKILILLSYYMLFGIMLLIHITLTINNAVPFRKDLLNYFECQLTGNDPVCEDIRRQFEEHLKPGLNIVSYFLIAFITWVNLLFAITGEDVKWLITPCCHLIAKVKLNFYEMTASSTNGSSISASSTSATNPLTHL